MNSMGSQWVWGQEEAHTTELSLSWLHAGRGAGWPGGHGSWSSVLQDSRVQVLTMWLLYSCPPASDLLHARFWNTRFYFWSPQAIYNTLNLSSENFSSQHRPLWSWKASWDMCGDDFQDSQPSLTLTLLVQALSVVTLFDRFKIVILNNFGWNSCNKLLWLVYWKCTKPINFVQGTTYMIQHIFLSIELHSFLTQYAWLTCE